MGGVLNTLQDHLIHPSLLDGTNLRYTVDVININVRRLQLRRGSGGRGGGRLET